MKKKDFKFLLIIVICILSVPLAVNAATCASLLGNPTNPEEPAYYVRMLFQIIKYVCIIFLFVFSVIDFAKALTSEDQGKFKVTGKRVGMRFVYLVALFFLPTVLSAVFEFLGIISSGDCSTVITGN